MTEFRRAVTRALAPTAASVGAVSLLAVLVLAVRRGDVAALIATGVAVTWLCAGVWGMVRGVTGRAVLLLMSVGALHLTSFAIAGWTAHLGITAMSGWGAYVVAQLLFAGGFVAVATSLATYPTGLVETAGQRIVTRVGVSLLVVHQVHQTLFSGRAEPVVDLDTSVPTPWTPIMELPSPVMPGLLLLLAGAVVVLLRRVRAGAVTDRRQGSWAVVAGLLLVTLIAATPAGTTLLGGTGWGLVFLVVSGVVPFALLAGIAGWRLSEVDHYVVQTFSRGLLVVLVLSAYAGVAALAARSWWLAAAVTVVAALVGAPGLRRAEVWADRWLVGGRVRAGRELRRLGATLGTSSTAELAWRTVEEVRSATGAEWVRLHVEGLAPETVGRERPGGEAEVVLPLEVGDQRIGLLECGRRPGGWSAGVVEVLSPVVAHVALAIREALVRAELAARVEELAASRSRLVAAEENVRRQVERDLHDGVQQQLVALLARLELLRHLLADRPEVAEVVAAARALAGEAMDDLRALTAGIHPAILSDRGLVVAIQERAANLPIPVTVDADPRLEGERFPPEIEGAAYFVVAEALTNAVKHSGAPSARVVLTPLPSEGLRVAVVDEGTGEAAFDPLDHRAGRGLAGLRDRVEALGGTFMLVAVAGVGTTVTADLRPIASSVAAPARQADR